MTGSAVCAGYTGKENCDVMVLDLVDVYELQKCSQTESEFLLAKIQAGHERLVMPVLQRRISLRQEEVFLCSSILRVGEKGKTPIECIEVDVLQPLPERNWQSEIAHSCGLVFWHGLKFHKDNCLSMQLILGL